MRPSPRAVAALFTLAALIGAASVATAQVRYGVVKQQRGKAGKWKAAIAYPQFRDRGNVARLANRSIRAWSEGRLDAFQRFGNRSIAEGAEAPGPLELDVKPFVSYAGSGLISTYFTVFKYEGGAHPNTDFQAHNYGLLRFRAKRLKLQDLFRSWHKGHETCSDLIIARLKKNPRAARVAEGSVTSLPKDVTERFVITRGSLTFLIPAYVVASYADGPFIVKIPYSDFEGKLNPAGPLKGLI